MMKSCKTYFERFKSRYLMKKKRNLEARSQSRRKLDQQQLFAIQELVDLHRGNAIKLASVRAHLIRNFPNSKIPCLSTIGRYMKSKLKLSYKTLEKKHPTSTKPENWRKFFESAWVQSTLEKQGVELIYIDEFSINTRHLKYKGWSRIGHKGYISVNLEEFSMSFIWALSRERVYGIMGCPGSIDHTVVRHFIKLMWAYRSKIPTSANMPFAIVFDNAFVHACSPMVEFYEKSNLKVVSIRPYSPSLNPERN